MDKERARKISFAFKVFICLFTAYSLISLITFSSYDLSELTYPKPDTTYNKGGIVGAYIAYFYYTYFGIGIFSLIALSLILLFKNKYGVDRYTFVCGAIFLQLSILALLNLQGIVKPSLLGLQAVTKGCGGLIGLKFELLLTKYFGLFGAMLISTTLGLFSLSLMLEDGLKPLISSTTNFARLLTDWSKQIYEHIGSMLANLKSKKSIERQRHPETIVKDSVHKTEELFAVKNDDEELQQNPISAFDNEPVKTPELQQQQIPQLQTNTPPAQEITASVIKKILPYEQPPLSLFDDKVARVHEVTKQDLELRKRMIESALDEFGVHVKVVNFEEGPTVTLYELELAPGTRIFEVSKLSDELSMKLMVPNIRVFAPLPGKGTVGIEVPNPFPNTVRLREFMETMGKQLRRIPLPLLLGKSNVGEMLVRNLTDMPHLLIAGTTGSGKSICLKSIIAGLVSTKSYEELKLFLIDPKMVELSLFEDIPHLWSPVITDTRKVTYVLDWLIKEMEDRYKTFNRLHVMKIETFNQLGKDEIHKRLVERGIPEADIQKTPTHLPYIVVVIDELADLMLSSGKEVENAIIRLSQKARAVGIHIIAATQRPSTDVVTGLIKSNMPARMSFKVASQVESRIILDTKGAERLLGKGDLLFVMPGGPGAIRAQCTYADEDEIFRLTKYLRSLGEPTYKDELLEIHNDEDWEGSEDDDMFEEACRIILESGRGSVSLLQRKLQIGYQRSARLIESMERAGIVGPYSGAKAREVYLTLEEWETKRKAQSEKQPDTNLADPS